MPKFAKGKRALSICGRCGMSFPYRSMKKELSGLWVCPDDYDGEYQALNHPQLKPPAPGPDAPLERPRPDVVMEPASVSTGGLRYL